jgi:hypothetical protein
MKPLRNEAVLGVWFGAGAFDASCMHKYAWWVVFRVCVCVCACFALAHDAHAGACVCCVCLCVCMCVHVCDVRAQANANSCKHLSCKNCCSVPEQDQRIC